MNRIDQKLLFHDAVVLNAAIPAGNILPLMVPNRDNDGRINATFFVDLTNDTGAQDAAVISVKILSDENATPVTEAQVVFDGTLGELKALLAKAVDHRLRTGVVGGRLGSYASMEVTCDLVTTMTFTGYFEITN